jgi:hypothetical protein
MSRLKLSTRIAGYSTIERSLTFIAGFAGGLLALTSPASAHDCDALIARMRQAVPAIAPEERWSAEDAKARGGDRAVTLIWHEEPGKEQVTLQCFGNRPPSLIAHWNGSKPPAVFWQMVGKLGGIAADADPGIVRSAAEASCAKALASIEIPKAEYGKSILNTSTSIARPGEWKAAG